MFVLLCLMLLSACTTDQASYRQQLQNWIGMSQEALYYSWGEPDSVIYPAPGTAVVTYTKIYDGPIGGNTEPYAEKLSIPPYPTTATVFRRRTILITAKPALPFRTARSLTILSTATTA